METETLPIAIYLNIASAEVNGAAGDFELEGIDLKVGEGQYFTFLGPTSVGKTILLETSAEIHRVVRGRIYKRITNCSFSPNGLTGTRS
jgi:ABC-type branched-subunit amino acid transport system ATPase component